MIFSFFFFQPSFADVEFPESNFVDQVELLLKDPEEKDRFFQVCNIMCCQTHVSYLIIEKQNI